MNKREIKRKSKDAFRKLLFSAPMPLKRYMTEKKIAQLTRPLLSEKDLQECLEHPERRREIVEKHRQNYPKASEKLERNIRSIAADPKFSLSEEEAAAQRNDIAYAYFAYGFQPKEYVYFHLAQKDLRTFISDTERMCVKFTMNDFTQSVFADKWKTYQVFKKWYKRDAIVIESEKDYAAYEEFAKKHPNYVVKVVNSSRGMGVWQQKSTGDYKRDFEEIHKKGKVLLEELIEQHEALSSFNPSSINTIRVSTYLTRDGVIPAHGIIRTGRAGSFVDNAGSGGIEALADVQKGVIISDGIDKYGHSYEAHPDTGGGYKGFVLPDWDEALTILTSASQVFPEVKYKSFDLAYSAKGWVIVEINPSGELGLQGCMETGMKETVRELMNNMDLICPYELR